LSALTERFRKYASTSANTYHGAGRRADTAQDVYMLQVDFSNAFNMIDHDKLLAVMWDLGFPTDAIDVV
jgi:hypothetical protein